MTADPGAGAGAEPTGYEQPPDEKPDEKPAEETPGRQPTAGGGGTSLTTDAESQRDDLPVRPGNEGA